MPGPKPTPTATLALRGSWRAKLRTDEPVPTPPADSTAPAGLSGRSLEVWTRLAPGLIGAGVLTDPDASAFARYCRLYALWERLMAIVEASSDRGAVLTLAKVDGMLRDLEASFGLTPVDRTSLRVAPAAQPTGKARFFEAR